MTAEGRVRRRCRWGLALPLLAAGSWSCVYATDVDVLEISAAGEVVGQAFLDLDGDGALSPPDEALTGAGVVLVASSTSGIVALATTDSLGEFELFDVPVGSYGLTLDPAVLGDSLSTLASTGSVAIMPGQTAEVTVGAAFSELALEDVLAAPAGRRLFTSGIALNARPNFGDGQVHFRGASAYLRALDVSRGALAAGDSVRLLGRVVVDNGRAALQEVTFVVLVRQAALVAPVEVSTGDASTAGGGALDAALARIRHAAITDTSTTAEGHFRFWADDGTGSVEFVIRDFLVPGVDTSRFSPDATVRIARATGLVSPFDDGSGSVRWRFLLRDTGDFALEDALADLAMASRR